MHTLSRRANGVSFTFRIVAFVSGAAGSTEPVIAEKRPFDIPAGSLAPSLYSFSVQSELQILFDADAVGDMETRAVHGELTATEALSTMFGGTALAFEFVNDRTVAIASRATRLPHRSYVAFCCGAASEWTDRNDASSDTASSTVETEENARSTESHFDSRKSISKVLIRGARTINVDIHRTEDDIRPHFAIDRDHIERSEAPDLDAFLKSHLTGNVVLRVPAKADNA
jgi:hypothetical protein